MAWSSAAAGSNESETRSDTVTEQYASERIDVPRIVSDEQVQSFVDEGFLVVEGLIRPDELDELKRDTVALARGRYPCKSLEPLDDSLSDTEVLQRILCIHQPHFVSPVITRFVKHEKIAGVLSQVVGAHLPHWDGSVKCMQSMLFVKPPTFQGQAWHQDEIYIPTRDRSLCGAWIAIDEATVANGCLWVIPGSHRSGYLYPQRDHGNYDEFDGAAQSWGFDDSGEVPVEVAAGSVVFFNGHLLHRSAKNRSDIYRRVLVNHYMNAWSRLPWGAGRDTTFAKTDNRLVVPVAGTDPYAWCGYETNPDAVYLRTCKQTDPDIDKRESNPQLAPSETK
jgi:ectoine hydroxylase-related dioxygenase (phytanoyl-CoA dioxygenase family)